MQIDPCRNQTRHNRPHKPRPVDQIFKQEFLDVYIFSLDSCASLKSVSFIANHYFKIFTNRLTMDTKIEVAENQRLVLLPTSEFRAFALLGVT